MGDFGSDRLSTSTREPHSNSKKMDHTQPTDGSKKPDEGDSDSDNAVTDDDEDKIAAAAAADTGNTL